jgi:hypothetical protein
MHGFDALGTLDVDPPLLEFYLDVDLEALHAEEVVAVPQQRELVQGDAGEAERTLSDLE